MGKIHFYSERCFVCGRSNPQGLRARIIGEGPTITVEAAPPQDFQGFDGVLHGGIVTAMLDEALWYAVYTAGHITMTVQLSITLRRSAQPGERLRAQAKFTGQDRRFLLAAGTLCNTAGELLAEAEGRFLPAPRLGAHLGELIYAEPVE